MRILVSLVPSAFIALLFMTLADDLLIPKDEGPQFVLPILYAVASFVIFVLIFWWIYSSFNVKKYVSGPLSKSVSSVGSGVASSVSAVNAVKDDILISIESKNVEYLAVAEEEVDNGTYDKGLWSKALLNAKGDESLRKIEYIKMRAKQLKKSSSALNN